MSTKQIGIAIASLAIVFAAGCHKSDETVYSDANGSVSVSGDKSKITYTDEKGNVASVDTNGGKTTIDDGKGGSVTMGAGQVSEGDLGVPFYPGSKETAMASGMIESGGEKMVTSMRTTTDDPGKVSDFYKEKVKNPQISNANSGGNVVSGMTGKLDDGSDFNLSATKTGTADTQITIVVKRKKG